MIMTARSPLGPNPHHIGSPSSRSQRDTGPTYFATQQVQSDAPPPPPPPGTNNVGSQPVSNTLAHPSTTSAPPAGSDPLEDPMLISSSAAVRQGKFTEEWEGPQRGSSILVENNYPLPAAGANGASGANGTYQEQNFNPQPPSAAQNYTNGASPGTTGTPQRSEMSRRSSYAPSITDETQITRKNTLRKKSSVRRSASLKRPGSRRSMKAGSVRSLALQSASDPDEQHSAFFCPVPTTGSPTDLLAARFQGWRKILKDLIAHFREVQNHYENRAKSLLKLANSLNNISTPPGFLSSGGVDDALQILRVYHKQTVAESQKAREIEEDVILALTGLRSDLQQKIKEIKNLGGDFKNSVEKEMDATRRAVNNLQEILGQSDLDSSLTTGKQDPYLLRLAVDRQLERQMDEETYLHQAYLNLESSGRELESIVVGEIQKSYNALASILKRDADCAYNTIDELRLGPITMPKDHEWSAFTARDDQFVDPEAPIRTAEHIHYPGRDHHACQEIRTGLLERKSKYLKSYTAGWYVLSPTHLHEFKSADKTGAPVMSLYLPEQKLGSHSVDGASSNKFLLKGRQTGSMHRGHTWVFRAESHDTMMAWYEDIKALTEKTPQERSEFVRSHSRAGSRASRATSVSSDGAVEDEEDEEAFGASGADATAAAARGQMMQPGGYNNHPQRPNPGGRFPSDNLVVSPSRGLQQGPLSPGSIGSSAAGFEEALQGGQIYYYSTDNTSSANNGMPTATLYPSSMGYDPNVTPGTHSLMPNPSQQLRTPSPSVGRYSETSGSPGQETPSRAPPENMANGVPGARLSHLSSDGGNGPRRTDSPTIRAAAAAVIGSGRTVSGNGVAYDGSGSEFASVMGKIRANNRDSMRVEVMKRPGAPRNDTVNTISNLHIPGEFPRGISQ